MRVCVCLRQVPDPRAPMALREDGLGVDESGVSWLLGESDECALEEALRLRGLSDPGLVCALTLGPERATEALRRALALGADRAVRLPGAPAADPRFVAARLASFIAREPWDLVLTGAQSSDLGWALTGPSLAARLGWPHVWLVVGVEPENAGDAGARTLLVLRELEERRRERSRVRLPAVLCVQAGLHPPRMPRIRDVLAAKQRVIEVVELEDGEPGATPGTNGTIELVALRPPPATSGSAEVLAADPKVAAREVVERLRRDGLLSSSA